MCVGLNTYNVKIYGKQLRLDLAQPSLFVERRTIVHECGQWMERISVAYNAALAFNVSRGKTVQRSANFKLSATFRTSCSGSPVAAALNGLNPAQ